MILVVIGCPETPWLIGAFQWTGALAWLLIAGVLMVTAWEVYGDRLRRRLAREGE